MGRGVAVVGLGTTEQGELPGRSADEIAAEAFGLALRDAGLDKSEVDGLITCKSTLGAGVDTSVGRLLGLNPAYSATLDYGTCNFSIHLATMVINAGLANTVALTYGTDARSNRVGFGVAPDGLNAPYGYLHIAGPAALALRRHQHLYGTTEEQLGHIAVNQRDNARLNPLAVFRAPLTLSDYLSAPYLVEPLRRHDLTMVSDGGAALIMTAADRASDRRADPVYLSGMAEVTALRELSNPDQLMRPWLAEVARRVYADAGLGPADVDLLYLQDPTSVWVLQMLEWFGFAPIGQAGPFLAEGHTRLDGRIPLNSNGGHLSESYMWGWLHVAELVRQLRGEAGPRQRTRRDTALYASTMAFQKGAASIFSRHR
ncbi:MAG TPA: thiolase family protein [Pseudonocardia sp.]|jgi:acetyl-CoA acetyltransferase